LNLRPEEVCFADGRIFSAANPENGISFARAAAASHWSPGALPDENATALRETVFWTPPSLTAPNEADEVNSSGAYGFVFDFCGIEIDRDTGEVRIDKYVTFHDAGRIHALLFSTAFGDLQWHDQHHSTIFPAPATSSRPILSRQQHGRDEHGRSAKRGDTQWTEGSALWNWRASSSNFAAKERSSTR
jgi:hypothetical protein